MADAAARPKKKRRTTTATRGELEALLPGAPPYVCRLKGCVCEYKSRAALVKHTRECHPRSSFARQLPPKKKQRKKRLREREQREAEQRAQLERAPAVS